MVCIPCFIIPVLLFIWHRFLQPYVLRYWNPWAKKDAQGNVITKPEETKFPIDCSGGKCIFMRKTADEVTNNETQINNPHESVVGSDTNTKKEQ